jgi:hypothetical protein
VVNKLSGNVGPGFGHDSVQLRNEVGSPRFKLIVQPAQFVGKVRRGYVIVVCKSTEKGPSSSGRKTIRRVSLREKNKTENCARTQPMVQIKRASGVLSSGSPFFGPAVSGAQMLCKHGRDHNDPNLFDLLVALL